LGYNVFSGTLNPTHFTYISVAESLGISSTTYTQCALKATEVAEITQKTAITPFKVIQGHRF